jgi:hypothetical protein
MLVGLLAVLLIVLTVLALLLAGAVAAVVTGIALLNVLATIVCARSRALRRVHTVRAESWRPSAFRLPPEPTDEREDDPAHSLTIHRR